MFESQGFTNLMKGISFFKLKYRINKGDKIRLNLFSRIFIKNNSHKCQIIYKNRKYELKENFDDICEYITTKNLISIKLIFISNIIDASYMFAGCNSFKF